MPSSDYILSKQLIEKIQKRLEVKKPPTVYWDYRDEISMKTISEALDKEYPLDEILDEDADFYEHETDHIKDTLEEFKSEIAEELEKDEDDIDFKELTNETRDFFLGYFSVDTNLKSLLRGNVHVRLTMHSNYDCINSFFFETTGGGYTYPDSYFGDMINVLKLNPADVKKLLNDKGVKTYGTWYNRPRWKPYVSLQDFWRELTNSSCGANLLVFVGSINQYDILTHGIKHVKITVGIGNNAGLYSSFQGGGSMIEMALLRPFTVQTNKAYDKSGYHNFSIELDTSDNGYTIEQVYGVCENFWDGDIEIRKVKPIKSTIKR